MGSVLNKRGLLHFQWGPWVQHFWKRILHMGIVFGVHWNNTWGKVVENLQGSGVFLEVQSKRQKKGLIGSPNLHFG